MTSPWTVALTTSDRLVQDFPNVLHQLADLDWAAVVIRDFYPPEHCREVAARIARDADYLVTTKEYANAAGAKVELRFIGPGLGQYVGDREGYFREARLAGPKMEKLYSGLPDPRKMVRDSIAQLLPGREVIVGNEDGLTYSDAVVRVMMEGDQSALHRDSAMTYFKGWMVSQFPTQFSALVCFQMSESGGELIVYKQRWTPEDDETRAKGVTGFDDSIVEGAVSCVIRPQEGDLYIFHPEIYHDISPMTGPRNRITQGIFFAISPDDNRVVSWG